MNRHVTMTFFETIIFPNIMKKITTDDNRTLHLHFDDHTTKNTATDRNITSKWTFLVNVISFDGLLFWIEKNEKRLDKFQIEKNKIYLHLWAYGNQDQLYGHNVELCDNDYDHQLVVFCSEKQSVAFEKLFHSINFQQLFYGFYINFYPQTLPVHQPIVGFSCWLKFLRIFKKISKKNQKKKTIQR